jgi:hypothetical protein
VGNGVKCKKCGYEFNEDTESCPMCGSSLSAGRAAHEENSYEWRRWSRVGSLSQGVLDALQLVQRTPKEGYPASATTRSGASLPCVLFFEVGSMSQDEFVPRHGLFRVLYRHPTNKMTEPQEIESAAPSRYTIPAPIADRMARFPEPFMGGPSICKVIMDDGVEFVFEGGWTHAFMLLPDGYGASQIRDVEEINSFKEYTEMAKTCQAIGEPHFALCMFRRPPDK